MGSPQMVARLKDEFRHSPVVSNVCFAFAMSLVEKIVEVEFACPCKPNWNALFATGFFVIPAIIVFLMMMIIHECKSQNNSSKCLYSFLPPLIWQVLLFLDGQYFVCAMTTWSGTFVSVDNNYLKWCTPTNTTRSEELLAHSQSVFAWSQGIGFGLLILFIIGLLAYGIKKCQKNH